MEKNDKEIFMQVKEIGAMYLYDVLLAYIYPRVFVCEDTFNSKYLFYEVSSKDDRDVWLVARISKEEYYSLVDQKIAIQKAYEGKSGFNFFTISKTYSDDEDIITLKCDADYWIKKLPQKLVFAEKQLDDDVKERTLESARDTGTTTLDIRLFPGTDRHFVPHNVLSDLCAAVTSLTNSVYGHRRSDVLRVATAPGSCIVRFSFPDQINLFNESNAINEMNVINDVLSSESISGGVSRVKDQAKFIRSYAKILDTIRKTGSGVQFTTASPNSNEVQKVELTKDAVQRRCENVRDIFKIESENVTYVGKLIALDIKSQKFKFLLDDETIIAGTVMNELFDDGSIELPERYEATVGIDRYINEKQECSKELYYLKELIKDESLFQSPMGTVPLSWDS